MLDLSSIRNTQYPATRNARANIRPRGFTTKLKDSLKACRREREWRRGGVRERQRECGLEREDK